MRQQTHPRLLVRQARLRDMSPDDRLALAASWVDWTQANHSRAPYAINHQTWESVEYRAIVGYLIQAAAEQPADFARAFEPIFGPELTNPLTTLAEGALSNLVRNGIGDDWEIYLQWRETGYVVVGEDQRRPQDARFGVKEAIRLLDIITGGQVQAPGVANEAVLVQEMWEVEGSRPSFGPGG